MREQCLQRAQASAGMRQNALPTMFLFTACTHQLAARDSAADAIPGHAAELAPAVVKCLFQS